MFLLIKIAFFAACQNGEKLERKNYQNGCEIYNGKGIWIKAQRRQLVQVAFVNA